MENGKVGRAWINVGRERVWGRVEEVVWEGWGDTKIRWFILSGEVNDPTQGNGKNYHGLTFVKKENKLPLC